MTPKSLQISTPTDTTIVLTRGFRAPRRLVWEAMFTPDKMRRWMVPPPGWTLADCDVSPCLAGGLRLTWRSADADPAMTMFGVFTEVAAHEAIVHTETMVLPGGQVVSSLVERHEFADDGGATLMRITQTYESRAARDGALESGMDQGMEACYCHLDALLAPG
ncbi:MAG: SRPBCC domain-containing protein [Polyangiaceae bacterium]|nr:SRPBCC domain-containing protein [Polyangiaceae bacterium]